MDKDGYDSFSRPFDPCDEEHSHIMKSDSPEVPNEMGKPSKHHHNLITHFPYDLNCEICQHCKIQKSQHRRGTNKSDQIQHRTKATKFGEHLTADHAIVGNGEAGRHGERVALIIRDEATGWLKAYPSLSKDSDSVVSGFQDFLSSAKCVGVYTDGPKEFEPAFKRLQIPHDTSTP